MLALHREGNPAGPTLFFVHGWPDDERIWDRQVEAFAPRYHCVRATLPGFGADDDVPRGLDFPELAEWIASAIDRICEERGEERLVLIAHDWGAYLAYLVEERFRRRERHRVDRLVTIDVGGRLRLSNARNAALIAAYQLPLTAAWLARGLLPGAADRLTRAVARGVRAPLENRRTPLRARMSYPYFYIWRALVVPAYRGALLRRYAPERPLLFVYGRRKPVMFHSPGWLSMLEARDDCEVVAIDGGHWLTLSHPREVNEAIARFLEER